MRLQAVKRFRGQLPLTRLCRLFGVSASGFHAWRSRGESNRAREDRRLRRHARIAFEETRCAYGCARLRKELAERGIRIGKSRLARLMREEGLVPKKARQRRRTTDSDHPDPIAPNLLAQDFTSSAPDRKWVSDLTYVRTLAGWTYLVVIIDLFSRRVVGWEVSTTTRTEVVLAALRRAVHERQPEPGLIFHSDRGSQFASLEFRAELEKHGMLQSMSGKGNCYDNAVAESFFDSIKTEKLSDRAFQDVDDVRHACFDYIERFYNATRRHEALDNVSPRQFENSRATATGTPVSVGLHCCRFQNSETASEA